MQTIESLKTFTRVLREYFSHYAWMLLLVLLFIGGMATIVFYSYADVWLYAREFITTVALIMMLGLMFIITKILIK